MLGYAVSARRIDTHGGEAPVKEAQIVLDTDINGRPDAFNPAELFSRRSRRLHDQGDRVGQPP